LAEVAAVVLAMIMVEAMEVVLLQIVDIHHMELLLVVDRKLLVAMVQMEDTLVVATVTLAILAMAVMDLITLILVAGEGDIMEVLYIQKYGIIFNFYFF
jgi:hypothetical protein